MAVPACASPLPTVPTIVGTQFLAVLCGLEAPVPTVPTYKYIYIKGACSSRAAAFLPKVCAIWWEQGTVSRKPAENRQFCRSKPSLNRGNADQVGNGS